MKLTPSNKEYIDSLGYSELLDRQRFSLIGDPWFEGETNKYWTKRMRELKEKHEQEHHIECRKNQMKIAVSFIISFILVLSSICFLDLDCLLLYRYTLGILCLFIAYDLIKFGLKISRKEK